MKKVCLINYTGSKGGGAQYTYELTLGLVNQGVPTVAVISALNEDLNQWKKMKLEKLIILDTYANSRELIINSLWWSKHRKQIKAELTGYEVTQIIVPMITFWTKRINRLFRDAQKIVALHDPIAHSGDKNKRALQLFGETSILNNADYIIVLSNMFIDFVEQKYNKNGKVIHIPMGTTNIYTDLPNKINTLIYDESKINFLFFGTISKYKGIEVLADAYRMVTEKVQNVTLTIAGSGDFSLYTKAFENLPHVEVHNRWIVNEEVESFFNNETVVAVLPYLDATQSGVIPVCVSYGVPIIASNAGGIMEQLNDYDTGVLIETGNATALADAMLRLVEDTKLRKKQRQSANENAKKFNWNNIAKKFLSLFN